MSEFRHGHIERWAAAALLAWMSLAAAACTDAEFEKIPSPETRRADEMRISGDPCTQSPENLVFPTRVLFLVDSSISMEITDPPDPQTGVTDRQRAVRETWKRLVGDDGRDAKVGIVRFSAQAQSKTPVDEDGDSVPESYFTSDPEKLNGATEALSETDRTTNFLNVLGEAYFEMRTELEQADQESLPRTNYSVIFLSDGVPQSSGTSGREGSREQILGSVEQLRELADSYDVDEFSFHTAFLATGRAAFDEQAEGLLEEMAQRGNGTFRSFPDGGELNFLFADLTSLQRAYTLRTMAAVNLNAVQDRRQIPDPVPVTPEMDGADVDALGAGDLGGADGGQAEPSFRRPTPPPLTWVDLDNSSSVDCGEPMVDTDGDGVADLTERRIGSDPRDRDTDDDGLRDLLEWELRDSGLDPKTPSKSKCYTPRPCEDENGDGRCDCILDSDDDGVCECKNDDLRECVGDTNRDCVDRDDDGWCDCRDRNEEGECQFTDTDGDGLHDCEEVFLGTAQRGNDTDADGLPDRVEARFDTNPAKEDLREDPDADRTVNEIEVLANTNPRCDDSRFRSRISYQYDISSTGFEDSKSCYDFEIDNMTLVPTLVGGGGGDREYPGDSWNRILLYAGEVAVDDPNSFATYRVACVMARYDPRNNYRDPPSGEVQLDESDFVEVRNFEPDEHCVWP